MAVSVMCQTQRCDKSDKANCRLASPRSKKLPRQEKLFLSHSFSLRTSLIDILRPEGDIWVAQQEKSSKTDVDVIPASECCLV